MKKWALFLLLLPGVLVAGDLVDTTYGNMYVIGPDSLYIEFWRTFETLSPVSPEGLRTDFNSSKSFAPTLVIIPKPCSAYGHSLKKATYRSDGKWLLEYAAKSIAAVGSYNDMIIDSVDSTNWIKVVFNDSLPEFDKVTQTPIANNSSYVIARKQITLGVSLVSQEHDWLETEGAVKPNVGVAENPPEDSRE